MDISNIIQNKKYPTKLKGYGIKILMPEGETDGLVEIHACFVDETENINLVNGEKIVELYKLKNGNVSFIAFSGSYLDLLNKVIESKQVSENEINILLSEVIKTRSQLRTMLEIAIETAYKANILSIPEVPFK